MTVWEHPGGTMSMIQIPDTNGEFLAVQGFRSGFMAQNTSLAWVKPKKNGACVRQAPLRRGIPKRDVYKRQLSCCL